MFGVASQMGRSKIQTLSVAGRRDLLLGVFGGACSRISPRHDVKLFPNVPKTTMRPWLEISRPRLL